MDNLDSIIDISLLSSSVNDRLKNNNIIQIIRNNMGIRRPVIDWIDLIRENFKINATKYAKVDDNDFFNFKIRELPYHIELLQNAITENRLDLIDKYWSYYNNRALRLCNTSQTFD